MDRVLGFVITLLLNELQLLVAVLAAATPGIQTILNRKNRKYPILFRVLIRLLEDHQVFYFTHTQTPGIAAANAVLRGRGSLNSKMMTKKETETKKHTLFGLRPSVLTSRKRRQFYVFGDRCLDI